MFKSLTSLQKLQYTLIGFGVMLLLVYLLSIKKTISEHRTYLDNLQLVNSIRSDSSNGSSGKTDIKIKYQQLQQQYSLDSAILDRAILSRITTEIQDVGIILKEYKPLSENKEHVWTRYITVEGGFKPILQFLFNLEQKDRLSRVASVNFQKIKNGSGKDWLLDCTIYLQNILNK